jgi:hypothetical protein
MRTSAVSMAVPMEVSLHPLPDLLLARHLVAAILASTLTYGITNSRDKNSRRGRPDIGESDRTVSRGRTPSMTKDRTDLDYAIPTMI